MASSEQCTRILQSYDPFEDAAANFPDWEFRIVHNLADDRGKRCTELIRWDAQKVDVDRDAFIEDPEHAWAHPLVHLRYHCGQAGDVMTQQQEDDANGVARLWLGDGVLW